jgi:hypothetical protein
MAYRHLEAKPQRRRSWVVGTVVVGVLPQSRTIWITESDDVLDDELSAHRTS